MAEDSEFLASFAIPRSVNYSRLQVLKQFAKQADFLKKNLSVAVVGGSKNDNEIKILEKKGISRNLRFYGIDGDSNYLDLNNLPASREKHDLLLCSNVLEHVHHHENFAKNISELLSNGGFAWISAPYSDMFHGSPYFYSSGFSPSYLEELFLRNNFAIVNSGFISSKRFYLSVHLMRDWPSEFRFKHPFFGYLLWHLGMLSEVRPPLRGFSVVQLLKWGFLAAVDKDTNDDANYGCSTWILVKKNNQNMSYSTKMEIY